MFEHQHQLQKRTKINYSLMQGESFDYSEGQTRQDLSGISSQIGVNELKLSMMHSNNSQRPIKQNGGQFDEKTSLQVETPVDNKLNNEVSRSVKSYRISSSGMSKEFCTSVYSTNSKAMSDDSKESEKQAANKTLCPSQETKQFTLKEEKYLKKERVIQGQYPLSESSNSANNTVFVSSSGKLGLYQDIFNRQDSIKTSKQNVESTADESCVLQKDPTKILDPEIYKKIFASMPPPLELTSTRQYSLKPDMAFGWRPSDIVGAPIPMYFNYEQPALPINPDTKMSRPIYYIGKRYIDSLLMHKSFANKVIATGHDNMPSYHFKFPPKQNVIDALNLSNKIQRKENEKGSETQLFVGNNPILTEPTLEEAICKFKNGIGYDALHSPKLTLSQLQQQALQLKALAGDDPNKFFLFDGDFESGNLDMGIQVDKNEFDLFMRVDSNTRGHHQWFYFKVNNQNRVGTVKFNIVNFTKSKSLYMHGMRINVKSMLDVAEKKAKLNSKPQNSITKQDQSINKSSKKLSEAQNEIEHENDQLPNEGWEKAGENISYRLSKLSQSPTDADGNRLKKYYQLSFEYTFKKKNDEVYFAYSLPYTVSKMHNLVKELTEKHAELFQSTAEQFISQSKFCSSLSGYEVPILTITSNVQRLKLLPQGAPLEIDPSEWILQSGENKEKVPQNRFKKYIVIAARVHPGESNASFIMQGFLKFITGQSPEAQELRKKIIFKVIPMSNPDGVIAGNYRTGLAGNDLNRQFIQPNPKLHPTVCAIKKLIRDITDQSKQSDPIGAFIDIHGHSRKKSVFMYGPSFPLHNERYFKSRVLPKLLDEKTQMFRFYSCKFRIEKSKLKAARVVLFREFGIMNCFTLEASFHGYIEKDRSTQELMVEDLEEMGRVLGIGFHEYFELVENDDRQKQIIRERLHSKKRKMKARDITLAIIKKEKAEKENCEEQFASDTGDDINSQNSHQNQNFRLKTKGFKSFSKNHNQAKSDSEETQQKKIRNKSLQGNFEHNQSQTLLGAQALAKPNTGYMELISEEELSVCRSEGSPLKKKRHLDANEHVQNAKKANQKEKKQQKYNLIKKESDYPEKRTLSQLYNELKKPAVLENQNKFEGDSDLDFQDQDDVSSCDQSFCSADDLSDADLKNIQGNILDVIKHFDKIYNPTAAQQEEEQIKEKMHRKQKIEKEKEKKKKKKAKEEKQKAKEQSQGGLPFQAKLTGNGGNPCTLVMERILKERQEKASTDFKNVPFLTTSKRISQGSETQNISQQILKTKKIIQQPINETQGRPNVCQKTQIQPLKQEKDKILRPFKQRNSQTDLIEQLQDSGKMQIMALFGVKGLAALSDIRKQVVSKANLKLSEQEQDISLPSDFEAEGRQFQGELLNLKENFLFQRQIFQNQFISNNLIPSVQKINLDDPKIIFSSQKSNLMINTNAVNERRASQEGQQYRLRSGISRPTLNKAQNTTLGTQTPQILTNSKNTLIIKARSSSGGMKKPTKITTALKPSHQMIIDQMKTPKQVEGQNSPRDLTRHHAIQSIQSPAIDEFQSYKLQPNSNNKVQKQALFMYGSTEHDIQQQKQQNIQSHDFEIKRVSKNKNKNETNRHSNVQDTNIYKENNSFALDQGPLQEIQNTLKNRQKKQQKNKINMHPAINQPKQETMIAIFNGSSRTKPVNTSHDDLAPLQLAKNIGVTQSQQRIFNMQKYTTIASKSKPNKRRNILKEDNYSKEYTANSINVSNNKNLQSQKAFDNSAYE